MAAAGGVNYSQLVKDTLTERWHRYQQSPRIGGNDLAVGMTLFTKIASESPSISTGREVSSERAPSSGVVEKIKAFIEDKAYIFGEVCQTGFPFSLLDKPSAEMALKCTLEDGGSILSHLMTSESRWMDEKELNERFGAPLQRLQVSEIAKACSTLTRAKGDNRAGYYLLWLIKQAAGCIYEIPKRGDFNDTTVQKVLSQFLLDSGSLENATHFVEILCYQAGGLSSSLYQKFLSPESRSVFLNFAIEQLRDVPMDRWPKKAVIITRILETLTTEGKLAVARALCSSKDPTTSEIGTHSLAALTARSLREANPHFTALTGLLPHFSGTHAQLIFNRPLVEFLYNKSEKDPPFIKRLNFNGARKVFVHGSLMMGVHREATFFNGEGLPPYLLAYDMGTEKMVWGIPLIPTSFEGPFLWNRRLPEYSLQKVGERLCLQFAREKKLSLIHPETGECDSTLEFPQASEDPSDCLHMSPEGFTYQIVEDRNLIGGKITDGRWNQSFSSPAPSRLLLPLSTHCGFTPLMDDNLALFGPTGDQVTIEGCMAAKAQGDKLYAIEKDHADKNRCLLTMRTLKTNNEVVSNTEKTIPINTKRASIEKICQNGKLILFSNTSPIFVDLGSQEVTYSRHQVPSYAKRFATDSGELWTWDEVSKNLWKVSPTAIQLMGSLDSSRGTTFVHGDQADRLYLVDIGF